MKASLDKTKILKIAVIGGKNANVKDCDIAYNLGEKIAERGHILLCGGRSGLMAAASKGAYDSGGMTVGILPGEDSSDANKWIKLSLPTGVGLARNSIIACSCDGAVAINGEFGTLSEIAYCKQFGRPVCTLNSWEIKNVHQVNNVDEAINYIEQECDQ